MNEIRDARKCLKKFRNNLTPVAAARTCPQECFVKICHEKLCSGFWKRYFGYVSIGRAIYVVVRMFPVMFRRSAGIHARDDTEILETARPTEILETVRPTKMLETARPTVKNVRM